MAKAKKIVSSDSGNSGAPAELEKPEVVKSKHTPEVESFLDDADRASMLEDLKEWGVSDCDKLSDVQIVSKVAALAKEFKKKSDSKEVDKLQDQLNSYIAAATLRNEKLPCKELISKLFNLNVPHFYLHIFRDQDLDMTKEQIWTHIRRSRIKPYNEVKEIFRDRAREAEPLQADPLQNNPFMQY